MCGCVFMSLGVWRRARTCTCVSVPVHAHQSRQCRQAGIASRWSDQAPIPTRLSAPVLLSFLGPILRSHSWALSCSHSCSHSWALSSTPSPRLRPAL